MRWLKATYPDVVINAEPEKPAQYGLDAIAAEANLAFFSKTWAQDRGYEDVVSFLKAQAQTFKDG